MLSASSRCKWVSPLITVQISIPRREATNLSYRAALVRLPPLDRIEQHAADHEHRDRAAGEQQPAAIARILLEIVDATLDRAEAEATVAVYERLLAEPARRASA